MDPLATHWLTVLHDNPALSRGLESVYAAAASAIAERGPACWASGRCCNFDAVGHRLYVTGLETAYTVAALTRGTDVGGTPVQEPATHPLPQLTSASLTSARSRGGCPFQLRHLCGVHLIKPLGCRVYFCDRSAQQWQLDLSERLLADIRALHDAHHLEYRYGEWRAMLELFTDP